MKYISHTIKTNKGKFISCRHEVEAITQMVYSGKASCTIGDKEVTVISDHILDGERTTIVEVTDERD